MARPGQEVALCTDCEKDYPPAGCHDTARSFERGYDQAIQEVLDEVQERAPELVKSIRQKYATWDEIMRRRDR